MDRDAFIAGLRINTIRPIDLVLFYRGLPRRVPGGGNDAQVAARDAVAAHLATLNAHTLNREVDHRVPVDIEEMSEMIADRLERFTSSDWAGNQPSNLDVARQTLAEVLTEIRAVDDSAGVPDADEWDGNGSEGVSA